MSSRESFALMSSVEEFIGQCRTSYKKDVLENLWTQDFIAGNEEVLFHSGDSGSSNIYRGRFHPVNTHWLEHVHRQCKAGDAPLEKQKCIGIKRRAM